MNWKERIVNGSSPRYRNHPGVAVEAARRLTEKSLPDQDYALAGNSGSAVVSKLSFDSDLLGISCGRIIAIGAQNELDAIAISQQAIDLAHALRIEHLSVRYDSDDLILLDALRPAGSNLSMQSSHSQGLSTTTRRWRSIRQFDWQLQMMLRRSAILPGPRSR
jgi:hypothetical protein